LGLGSGVRLLDVASGKGESANFLAAQFGCHVVGVDFGPQNVKEANSNAAATQVAHLVSFVEGDAEAPGFSGRKLRCSDLRVRILHLS
jgi:ubiquinone/menaquinone biosynthesis C-methylase UbiE